MHHHPVDFIGSVALAKGNLLRMSCCLLKGSACLGGEFHAHFCRAEERHTVGMFIACNNGAAPLISRVGTFGVVFLMPPDSSGFFRPSKSFIVRCGSNGSINARLTERHLVRNKLEVFGTLAVDKPAQGGMAIKFIPYIVIPVIGNLRVFGVTMVVGAATCKSKYSFIVCETV